MSGELNLVLKDTKSDYYWLLNLQHLSRSMFIKISRRINHMIKPIYTLILFPNTSRNYFISLKRISTAYSMRCLKNSDNSEITSRKKHFRTNEPSGFHIQIELK